MYLHLLTQGERRVSRSSRDRTGGPAVLRRTQKGQHEHGHCQCRRACRDPGGVDASVSARGQRTVEQRRGRRSAVLRKHHLTQCRQPKKGRTGGRLTENSEG